MSENNQARVSYPRENQKGSIELIVIGLLAALIIVLAIPLLKDIGEETENNLRQVRDEMVTIGEDQDDKQRTNRH